ATFLSVFPRARRVNPGGIVDDFESNLDEELDFRREALNLDEFNEIMGRHGFDDVAAPQPYHEWSSQRLLVMERFQGTRIDDVEALAPIADKLEEMLLLGMRAWFRSLLVHGFFHGDVHAGNLMVLDDGRIGFLDFGIVGRFEGDRRLLCSRFLMSMAARDFTGVARCMIDMSGADNVDAEAMGATLEESCGPILDPSR